MWWYGHMYKESLKWLFHIKLASIQYVAFLLPYAALIPLTHPNTELTNFLSFASYRQNTELNSAIPVKCLQGQYFPPLITHILQLCTAEKTTKTN